MAAAALARDTAATATATSAPSPSAAVQSNTPASQTDSQQTVYECTLHGLIPNPPPSTATAADPSAPTLSNLLAVLSSITPRHSAHITDYSQHAMVGKYALYQPASLMPGAPLPPNTERPLHSRLTALAAILRSNHTDARTFCHYERIYAAASATAAQAQLPLRLSRAAVAPLPTTPFVLTSYSRPLPPARHSTHVRAIRTVPLHHITRARPTPTPTATATTTAAAPAAMDECDAVMELLSYHFDYELVREGFVWPLDGGVSVSVWRLCRLGALHDVSTVEVVRGMQWVVEVTAQAVETQLSAVEERVMAAAKQLQPLVKCTKIVPET